MAEVGGLSEYEQQRLAHIRRNQEYLERLGLGGDNAWSRILGGGGAEKEPAPRRKKDPKPRVVVDESQCRRSRRSKGSDPEYNGVQFDSFFERQEAVDSEEEGGWKATDGSMNSALSLGDDIESLSPVGKPRGAKTDEEKEAQYAAIIADSKNWLATSRAALCNVGGGAAGQPSKADEWMAEAIRRWGPRVADVQCDDWEIYVKSRISHPPPPSPLELLQEFVRRSALNNAQCCCS